MKEFAVFHDKVADVVVLKLKQGLPHPQIRIVDPTRAEVQLLEQLAAEHNALAKVKVFLQKFEYAFPSGKPLDSWGDECRDILDALAKEGE